MSRADRLTANEEALWRALMRIVAALPRHLDADLMRAGGITSTEYLTLVALSEALGQELRMTDLASATALSASRMTRLVDELQSRGLVTKRPCDEDGRGSVAGLTPAGLAKLEVARATHASTVRALVFDHVDGQTTRSASQALSAIAARLETQL